MVDHRTLGVKTARPHARVLALVVQTGESIRTVRVQQTLGPAVWGSA